MDNFLMVARETAVLFVLMGVGAACRRARLLDSAAVSGMVNLLVYVVTPCLIVDSFRRPFDPAGLRSLAAAFAVAAALHVAAILLASAVSRGRSPDRRAVMSLAMVFSNAGFMGIPLEQAILGEDGVFFGIVYVVVFNLAMWSWGYCRMKGSSLRGMDARQARTLFVNPGTVGLAVGLPVFLFSVDLPSAVSGPVGMLAALNTPLAMVVVGYHLAGARLGAVLGSADAYVAAAVRLVVCPLALVGVLWLVRGILDRTMMLALVTAASAPVAAMVSMFAAKFGRDVDMSVGLVSGTTLLSMATMPAVVSFAMSVL